MVEVTKLNLGRYSESRFGQDLTLDLVKMLILVAILKFMLNRDSEIVRCSRFVSCEL